MSNYEGLFLLSRGRNGNVGAIDAAANRGKSTNIKKLGCERGAVFRPSHNFVLQSDESFTNAVNCPVNSVRAGASSITQKMIEGVCPEKLAQ